MDTKTGNIYPSYGEGFKAIVKDLMAGGVPQPKAEQQARTRLVTGPKPTLRKLQKMIRAQIKREAQP